MDYAGIGKEKMNKARETAEDLIEQASEMRDRLGRGASDAWKESKRAYSRLQDSAEDAIDDTRVRIRKRPFESVATAAALGGVVGLFFGYMLGSSRRRY